ncbi:MAG TPA: hypothetical protein RMI62_01865, partial [Polyangiaceae bacterium LLY-WYZ-15_(1-7)]|nr:hypothetical protein [Polyangiaceae bacterium LLY-WYZ-15_(1-7)]
MCRAPLLLLAVLAFACGDDDAPPDGSSDGGGVDAEVLDGAVADAGRLDGGEDAGAPDAGAPSCSELLAPRAPFAIAPGFRGTQIHPAVVFDGERLWVTFTAVEEGEGEGRGFDVFVLSLDCAGEVSAPVQVNAAVEPNDIDGTVAVHGERVLVAWQADEGTGTIGTVVRAFDRSLAPIGGDRPLTTTRLGEPVLGTTWMPELHPRGEDGFLLVGSRGVEALSTFQVFLQALDADGEASGETVEPASVEGAAQSTPTMLALGDELHLAWVQEPQMGNAQGVYLAPGAEAPAPIA